MKKILIVVAALAVGAYSYASESKNEISKECCKGCSAEKLTLKSFHDRALAGDALTVAFLGGSLTWGANASDPNRTSARALVGEKLRARYPLARWRFVDAAIGGTGSELGVFRVERDVLKYEPDLVFLDFTINDGIDSDYAPPFSSYESILRTVLTRGKCPIVPIILTDKRCVCLKELSGLKRRNGHLKLAEYYNLSVADIAGDVNKLYLDGKVDVEEMWPADLFDTCHPYDPGYAVYADCIFASYEKGVKENKKPQVPEKWLYDDMYRNVKRFKLAGLKTLPKGWRVGKPETRAGTFDFLSSRWQDKIVIAENCVRKGSDKFELNGVEPESLTLKFRGSRVMLFGESTIYCGDYTVLIDGKEFGWAKNSANKFGESFTPSAYLYHPITLGKSLDPDVEHTLTIVPRLKNDKPQQLHFESICIASPKEVAITEIDL